MAKDYTRVVMWGAVAAALLAGTWLAFVANKRPQMTRFLNYVIVGVFAMIPCDLLPENYSSYVIIITGAVMGLGGLSSYWTKTQVDGAAAGIVLSCVIMWWTTGCFVEFAVLMAIMPTLGVLAAWKYEEFGVIVVTSFVGAHGQVFGLAAGIELLGWERYSGYRHFGLARVLYQAGAIVLWMAGMWMQRRHAALVRAPAAQVAPQQN